MKKKTILYGVLFALSVLKLTAQTLDERVQTLKKQLSVEEKNDLLCANAPAIPWLGIPAFAAATPPTDDDIPLAPEGYRRPEGYDPVPFRYKYSLQDMHRLFSDELMQRAAKEYGRMTEVIDRGAWKPNRESLSAHPSPEWFQDMKFGMFIDWGLWSVGGYAIEMGEDEIYPDWYEYQILADTTGKGRQYVKHGKRLSLKPYHTKNWGADFERGDMIPFFTAEDYDPARLTDLAVECGMKYIIPFCKHFSGFCIWNSSYTRADASKFICNTA
jgi:alpha-L-fucosidase